jgi:hypothetical protein
MCEKLLDLCAFARAIKNANSNRRALYHIFFYLSKIFFLEKNPRRGKICLTRSRGSSSFQLTNKGKEKI